MKSPLTTTALTLLFCTAATAQNYLPFAEILPQGIEIEANSSSKTIPLSVFFTSEEIDNQIVRFTAQYDDGNALITKNLDFALLANRTPITRTNFLSYVTDGSYINSFIHRAVQNFVIQGGGFALSSQGIVNVPTKPPIVNEPGISNTLGTVSMAKLGGDPDSATSQFFVSVANNASNLDFQNGGFTVFAQITRDTLPNAQLFSNPAEFPPLNFGGALTNTPIHNSFDSSQSQVPSSKFILFPSVTRQPLPPNQASTSPTLTYSITTPPATAFASATINPTNLSITPAANARGLGTVTLQATDSVGNTVNSIANLRIGDSYATWRAANYSGAALTNDTISGPLADPNNNGITNLQAFAQGLTLAETTTPDITITSTGINISYLEQIDSLGTAFVIERSSDLSTDWTEVSPQNTSRQATAKPNQQRVTASIAPRAAKDFYRIRFDLLPLQ